MYRNLSHCYTPSSLSEIASFVFPSFSTLKIFGCDRDLPCSYSNLVAVMYFEVTSLNITIGIITSNLSEQEYYGYPYCRVDHLEFKDLIENHTGPHNELDSLQKFNLSEFSNEKTFLEKVYRYIRKLEKKYNTIFEIPLTLNILLDRDVIQPRSLHLITVIAADSSSIELKEECRKLAEALSSISSYTGNDLQNSDSWIDHSLLANATPGYLLVDLANYISQELPHLRVRLLRRYIHVENFEIKVFIKYLSSQVLSAETSEM